MRKILYWILMAFVLVVAISILGTLLSFLIKLAFLIVLVAIALYLFQKAIHYRS